MIHTHEPEWRRTTNPSTNLPCVTEVLILQGQTGCMFPHTVGCVWEVELPDPIRYTIQGIVYERGRPDRSCQSQFGGANH